MKEPEYKSFGRNLNEFCSRYRARARTGQPIRQAEPIRFNHGPSNYRDLYELHVNTFEVPTVELTISESDLADLMNELAEVNTPEYNEYLRLNKVLGYGFIHDLQSYKYRQSREEQMRNRNPGVKKAWENYQLMLKLAGE